ncbi:MAG: cytochrome c biogenesis protein CcsA, partial [Akkermansiaceae bacterium]|nr:cytochrome c biogenesis protein CcsA [Akkermansiaceae bacterium]
MTSRITLSSGLFAGNWGHISNTLAESGTRTLAIFLTDAASAERAAAEVGVFFCTLVLLTGPIWAKGTWGHWWSWDPRLTLTLLLWFVYSSYLLLRSFTEGSARAARFSAVYGIAGVFAIPLNYFAIELFGGAAMHPDNLERGSLGEGMGWPFAIGVATGLVAYLHL